jgi:Ni,Fe-hydrogenase III small subunit/ferredoxin-like protein FixX
MPGWVFAGLRSGIKSTRYPDAEERAAGVSPGLPRGRPADRELARSLAASCPTGAITEIAGGVAVDEGRCVHCFRCRRAAPAALDWQPGYEWAAFSHRRGPDGREAGPLPPSFARSLQILVVDAGDCGACLHEVKQLNGPYYNMHRLGLFITPTPRHADVLLVVGTVTAHMRWPLLKAYEAMPAPRRVVAVGACAISGGVFGPSFTSSGGVGEVIPVDVVVPGNPPPPLAILHGLLLVAGRRPMARS